MASFVLYHNPRCSKSRSALEILQERGVDFEIVAYLDQPLDRNALLRLLDQLPNDPTELVRKDKNFQELGLDPDAYASRDAVVALLLEHPKLMQRPVLSDGQQARIGRPAADAIVELLP